MMQTIMTKYHNKLMCRTTTNIEYVGTIDNSAQSFIDQSLKAATPRKIVHLAILINQNLIITRL